MHAPLFVSYLSSRNGSLCSNDSSPRSKSVDQKSQSHMNPYQDWMRDGWYATSRGIAKLKREVRAEREPSCHGSAASDDADTFSFTTSHGKVGLRNRIGEILELDEVIDLPISHALLTKSGDYDLSENDKEIVRKWSRFVVRVGVCFTGANVCLNSVSNCTGPRIKANRPVPFDTGEHSVLASTAVDFMAQGCRMRVMHTSNCGRLRDEGVYFFSCSLGPDGWTWDQAIPALEEAASSSTLCAELAADVRTLRIEECAQPASSPNPTMLSTFHKRGKSDACYVVAEAVDSGTVFITNCNSCSTNSMEDCCTRILLAAGAPHRCIFSLDMESGKSLKLSLDRESGKRLMSLSLPGYDSSSLLRMGYRKVDMSWVGSMRDYRHVDPRLIPLKMQPEKISYLYITGRMESTMDGVLQAKAKVTVRCLRDLSRAKAALQANPRMAADAFCLLPVHAEMQNWVRSNANCIEQIPVPSSTGKHWLNLGVKSKSDVTEP